MAITNPLDRTMNKNKNINIKIAPNLLQALNDSIKLANQGLARNVSKTSIITDALVAFTKNNKAK